MQYNQPFFIAFKILQFLQQQQQPCLGVCVVRACVSEDARQQSGWVQCLAYRTEDLFCPSLRGFGLCSACEGGGATAESWVLLAETLCRVAGPLGFCGIAAASSLHRCLQGSVHALEPVPQSDSSVDALP